MEGRITHVNKVRIKWFSIWDMKQAFRPNISQKRSSELTQYPQLKIVFGEFMDRKHLVQDTDDDIAVCSLYEVFFQGCYESNLGTCFFQCANFFISQFHSQSMSPKIARILRKLLRLSAHLLEQCWRYSVYAIRTHKL